jgi:hypothetical protein
MVRRAHSSCAPNNIGALLVSQMNDISLLLIGSE